MFLYLYISKYFIDNINAKLFRDRGFGFVETRARYIRGYFVGPSKMNIYLLFFEKNIIEFSDKNQIFSFADISILILDLIIFSVFGSNIIIYF